METILISLPVFITIFIGWLFHKIKIVEKDWVHILNRFAYYIALPCLIVSSFWQINFLNKGTWFLILESVVIIVLFSIFVFIILSLFKINKTLSTTILLGSIVGNCIFIGFPLSEINFGKEYLAQTALIGSFLLIIPIVLVIIFIQYRHCSRKLCFRSEIINILKNPLVLSIIFGILLSFLKMEYPVLLGLKKTIALLGATASLIALFALGAFLHNQSKKNLEISFLISFFKMILLPAIAIFISFYLFKNNDFKVLALLASMPVAVTTFIIAEKFELNKELIGSSILVSTIFSFIIVPVVIFLFS